MASQKRPSQRHGSKYLASASPMDHARHGFLPRAPFPESSNWEEEIVGLDRPWRDAEATPCSRTLSSAS
uniref:Myelin basic protein n=1 Tax=Rhinolophus ferrumequinum TaxID=59479 RepID=A0A671FTR2_RHIFE